MGSNKSDRSYHADTIIRNHVIFSMGAGAFIPVPVLDSLGVAAVQVDMIRQLCKVYRVDFKETQYKAIVSSLTGAFLARTGAKSLIKLIPVVGNILGGAAIGVISGASTYALGEIFKTHFENGGNFMDVDIEWMKKRFEENFEKGKAYAEQMRKEQAQPETEEPEAATATAPPTTGADDILARLRELGDLKEKGVISEEEFTTMKKKLIDEF
ncbi:MAG: DUF697 domain-containing protein [Bacteroidota bacterium]